MGVRRWAAPLLLAVLLAACGGAPGDDTGAAPPTGAPRAEPVAFTTDDGVELNGFQFGTGETAAVLAHMHNSSKDAWTDVAVALSRNGVTAFTFDFRGYEGQDGSKDSNLDVDVLAAVKEVRARGAAKVFVIGASMGGAAALAVAAEHKIDGVVAVSSPAEFAGIDAVFQAGGVDEPSLFVVARADEPFAAYAERLADAAGGQLLVFDGASHGTDLLADHHDAFVAAIVGFVKDRAAPPG